MWVKNGEIYDGKLTIDGWTTWGASDEQLREAGYVWVDPPIPEPAPKKYSKRKVILALGEGWADKKAELEAAGVYDLFVNSEYLCVDDPTFAAVYDHLTDEEKRILDEECLYDD